MCVLIALHRHIEGFPLVVAANRDEFYDRPAEGPALREGPAGLMLAPLDARAGGTWLGVGPGGLLAAVTNRACPSPDPERRSRGFLVGEALAAGSAEEAASRLESLPSGAYNPFNFFAADRRRACLVTYDEKPRRLDLEPGVHVIGNIDPLAPPTPKLARLREGAERAARDGAEGLLERLAALCRSHGEAGDPLGDPCVHTPRYGTRSSILLRLAGASDGAFHYADGAPCRAAYGDFTPLLRELERSVQTVGGAAP